MHPLRFWSMIFLSAAFVVWTPFLQADVCKPSDPQTALQYLRKLSLDLRGYLPSPEEAEEVIQAGQVPQGLLDKMLRSPEALQQLDAYHRDLLWVNLGSFEIFGDEWRLDGDGDKTPLWMPYRSKMFRASNEDLPCKNEPAEFNDQGRPKTTCSDGDKRCQEGFVMIRPYWAPDKEIKVCAFDAQAAEKAGYGDKTVSCGMEEGRYAPECGCGPSMRYCQSRLGDTERKITQAMADQLLEYARHLIREGKPYSQVIQGETIRYNGVLVHFLRHQLSTIRELRYEVDATTLPDLNFHQADRWVDVKQGPLFSGILTSPIYLLKFASQRGRAHRFYNAFLCKTFEAPAGGLPPGQDSCHEEPNIMKRCGCKYCHQTLEPAASFWGRFIPAAVATLPPDKYPPSLDKCTDPRSADNEFCRTFYFTRPTHPDEERYRGYLQAYVFADEIMKKNIEQGPRGLAQQAIQGGTFGTCTVRKLWNWFVGHPLPREERIEAFALLFQEKNYDLLALLGAILQSPEYRLGSLYKPESKE